MHRSRSYLERKTIQAVLNYLQYQSEAFYSIMLNNLLSTSITTLNADEKTLRITCKSLKASFLRKLIFQTMFQRHQLHLYSKKNQLQNEKYLIQLSSSLLFI